MDKDLNVVAAKTAPALAGVSYALTGLPWAELAAAATFLYMVLQCFLLIPKYAAWYRDWRKRRGK